MTHKERLKAMSPDEALKKLVDGNLRFINNHQVKRDYKQEMASSVKAQHPHTLVLGCVDSRVPVEILFDQGIGNIFVSRVAGNIESKDVIAGMEYACEVVGSKLIMVLGHENCGAVKATCDDVKLGHITGLVKKIKPALIKSSCKDEFSSKNAECVNKIAKTNVKLTIERIREKSPILNKLETKGTIKIVGGYYNVSSGKVDLLET